MWPLGLMEELGRRKSFRLTISPALSTIATLHADNLFQVVRFLRQLLKLLSCILSMSVRSGSFYRRQQFFGCCAHEKAI